MIYRSNLTAPELTVHFQYLHSRPMGHSFGHDVSSDWADKPADDPVFGLYKNCGMLTHDEAAIVYNIAKQVRGSWLDIGSHTGWGAAHIAAAGGNVTCVDPMFGLAEWQSRFEANVDHCWDSIQEVSHKTSLEFFTAGRNHDWDGVLIDGDHEPGKPLEDARNAAKHLRQDGVILFHDGIGKPVREAVTWLLNQGFKARIYWTPHIVFCCWRGDFEPPYHIGDPSIDWQPHIAVMERDFDFARLS